MQQLFPQRDVKIPKATDRDMMAAPPKTPEELEAAYRAGDFGGRRPSDLFLTVRRVEMMSRIDTQRDGSDLQ
jgi:hypothetical protein